MVRGAPGLSGAPKAMKKVMNISFAKRLIRPPKNYRPQQHGTPQNEAHNNI